VQGADQPRDWRLYLRAIDIIERRANGHALPILRKLAARGFAPAINVLSDYLADAQAIRLLRRSARAGDMISIYNLAITHRNRGDLLNYRLTLSRAARLDPDYAAELRQFKTRFPAAVMRRHRRLAPNRDRQLE
jgi:TPR repeat protein